MAHGGGKFGVIAGHGRLMAARKLGIKEVLAIVLSTYLVVRLFSCPGSSPFYYRSKK